MTRKLVIVGAGPVGCLAAMSFANMGWSVEIYEARPGIRHLHQGVFILPVHKNVNARYAPTFFASGRPTAID